MFESLSEIDENAPDDKKADKSKSKVDIDEIIMNAKTVNGLLNIAESQGEVSRKHALKVSSKNSIEIHQNNHEISDRIDFGGMVVDQQSKVE